MNKKEFLTYSIENLLIADKIKEYWAELEKQQIKCTKIPIGDRDLDIQFEYKKTKVKRGMQSGETYTKETHILDINNQLIIYLSIDCVNRKQITIEYTGNMEGFWGFQHFIEYKEGDDILRMKWQKKENTEIKTEYEVVRMAHNQ